MDLRPRKRQPFSGFTKAEVLKMEQLIKETKEETLDDNFFKKLARVFSRSSDRAGKPIVKWTKIQIWFQKNQNSCLLNETSSDEAKPIPVVPEALNQDNETENPKIPGGKKGRAISKLKFEAQSSTDGAWYDVDTFLSHRFISSGEIEVHVRYVGFGAEEDEWVNVRNAVRERSVALEDSECRKVKVGDLLVCFQERQDQARHYDARVVDIQRKLHDIRGCRCLFLIRYDHDNSQERVRLPRLCFRPDILARMENN